MGVESRRFKPHCGQTADPIKIGPFVDLIRPDSKLGSKHLINMWKVLDYTQQIQTVNSTISTCVNHSKLGSYLSNWQCIDYTFFLYKKPFYKKPRAAEAKKLSTKGLHFLTLRNFSIVKHKIGYFSSNFVGKFYRKRQKSKKLKKLFAIEIPKIQETFSP